jgi:hypothetical protein
LRETSWVLSPCAFFGIHQLQELPQQDMKIPRFTYSHRYLIRLVIGVGLLLSAGLPVSAQVRTYTVGDRVECDWLQNGGFDKGTVAPFQATDTDRSGRWYRVKLDKDSIPNSTVECMADRLRPITEQGGAPQTNSAQKIAKSAASAQASAQGFKPGERVECDKAQIGVWEKGTVVPYSPGDNTSGSMVRVRLDGYKLYPAGHECLPAFIRKIGGAGLQADGKYKIGDAVEAKNPNNTWLAAKIIGVDGAFYKVRYDDRDSRFDEMLDQSRLRPPGTREVDAKEVQPAEIGPAPHSLPGTAWKMDFGKGVTGTVFLFCKGGRWENVLPSGRMGIVGRSYSVAGSTLTTVNADDGKVQKWRMTWKGDILELNDGKQIVKLHYNGETQCK